MQTEDRLRLNLGAGDLEIPGFIPRDGKAGDVLYPLPEADETIDTIRASHVLEHFPHRQIQSILNDWVRALQPGGTLKIAVPDFADIASRYLAGQEIPVQGFLMGGQVDERDFHKAIFEERSLAAMMRQAGLVAIRRWTSEIEDCAALPISLNLAGTKPGPLPKVAAVISMPRLGFNDFWACAYQELAALKIPLRKTTGAYWDRDLTAGIEQALEEYDPEWILTCDYDTVFTRDQVQDLLNLASRYPHADAIAPLQTARHHGAPMFTARQANGDLLQKVDRDALVKGEMLKVETAHFGLTLLRASALRDCAKPWFQRTYSPDGAFEGPGAHDPDVRFWHQWKAQGKTLYIALRVPVGHCELMVRWPDINLDALFQMSGEFWKNGPPSNVWR